jgi:large subunit ribosomal protein L5
MATTTNNITPIKLTSKQYIDDAISLMQKENPEINTFALSQIDKIIINSGVGNKFDNKQQQDVANYLYKLTSQQPAKVASRVSIASFKLRKGQTVGLKTTLRGKKAYDFLMHTIYIALPKTRDFKGINPKGFDNNFKCYSLGISNTNIYPAIGFDNTINFGIQINIVFKQGDAKNRILLEKLNFPFKKDIVKK